MDYPKFIVSYQKEESISIQRVNISFTLHVSDNLCPTVQGLRWMAGVRSPTNEHFRAADHSPRLMPRTQRVKTVRFYPDSSLELHVFDQRLNFLTPFGANKEWGGWCTL